MGKRKNPPTCYRCGKTLLPVVYGLAGPDLMDAAMRGEVVLGGCTVAVGASPDWACPVGHDGDLPEPGWPEDFPVDALGRVLEGIPVWSLSGTIEGRTTGGRRPCLSKGCPGWLLSVSWETGQQMHICSEGWTYYPERDEVRVVAGGEVSARYVSPKPLGTPPRPREDWPESETLKGAGWRYNPKTLG